MKEPFGIIPDFYTEGHQSNRSLQLPHTRYEEALSRVLSLSDFERSSHSPRNADFHIERMLLMLEKLGNPHLGTTTVHIAGTDGKGSTAAMVTSILTEAGYKVGLYTSPHLHSVVERIRVGLESIDQEVFADLVEMVWPTVDWIRLEGKCGQVSFFEFLTTMAFLHFKQIEVDFQVIEVGLGGRLDATNVIHPDVCLITRISLDHVSTLGNTLSLVAREKAGIIKHRTPVVVAPQLQEVLDILRRVSSNKEAPLVQVDDELSWNQNHVDLDGQTFELSGLIRDYSLHIPLLGDHQLENAASAVAAVETLSKKGFEVPVEAIVGGLNSVKWPGRFQVLHAGDRQIVVDGAHNPEATRRMVETVRRYFEFKRVLVIFGALGGHSAKEVIRVLSEMAPKIAIVQSRHPRSLSEEVLTNTVTDQGMSVFLQSSDVGLATRQVLNIARKEDLVLATGSLSVVAEVIEEVNGVKSELYPYLKLPNIVGGVS